MSESPNIPPRHCRRSKNPSAITPLVSTENRSSSSTAFNAYPLESSTRLLNVDNGVIYMPLSPSDVPLSIYSHTKEQKAMPEIVEESYGQPICHGLFFQNSPDNVNVGNAQEISTLVEKLKSNVGTHDQMLNELEINTEKGLQLLLLQQLIALQLSQQYTPVKNIIQSVNIPSISPHSTHHPEVDVKNVVNYGSIPVDGALNYGQTDMSTFLVPVEAKFDEDSSLALHITPRDENLSAMYGNVVTMKCPDQPLVLYPYKTLAKGQPTVENSPPLVVSETAQALTMNDIHQCIRRGSLEASTDPNYDIVQSIRGGAKPGFVLLSVRHEKINNHLKTSPDFSDQAIDVLPTSNETTNLPADSKKDTSPDSVKKPLKKKNKYGRCENEQKRRSIRRGSKVIKAIESTNIYKYSTKISEDDLGGFNAKSRFRVTRFADKKQTWMAPSKAGCFAVHDLWTRKLPDYVLRCTQKELKYNALTSSDPILVNKTTFSIAELSNGYCTVCENHPPKPCQCSADYQPSTSTPYHDNVPVITTSVGKHQ